MDAPFDIREIASELVATPDSFHVYVHGPTGEMLVLPDRDVDGLDDGDLDAERERVEHPDWVVMPTHPEIDTWRIRDRFARSQADPAAVEALSRALRQRGAYGRFRDEVDRRGLRDAWFAHEQAAFERVVRDALCVAGWLKFDDGPADSGLGAAP
ncbi:MAG: hypothetical protein JNM10_14600 [Planctomycetia bacterium]|nr:hypothetical protein [Planctomycetia bacterium]